MYIYIYIYNAGSCVVRSHVAKPCIVRGPCTYTEHRILHARPKDKESYCLRKKI